MPNLICEENPGILGVSIYKRANFFAFLQHKHKLTR